MFLRISPDEYINTDEISHIKAIDSMNCLVTTEAGIYTAAFPMETLIGIINGQKPDENKEVNILQEMNNKIGNLPVFAG